MIMREDEGYRARLVINKERHYAMMNQKTVAVVENFPFLSRDRDFANTLVWKVSSDEQCSASMGIWPSNVQNVDYGESFGKIVRGTIKGLITAVNIADVGGGAKQCKVVYHQVRVGCYH